MKAAEKRWVSDRPWDVAPWGDAYVIMDATGAGPLEAVAIVGWYDDAALIVGAVNTIEAITAALEDLVARCDGEEGVRADGSNIQTMRAHAVLDAVKDQYGSR